MSNTDYDTAIWIPANPINYASGSTRPASAINMVVIHDMEGGYAQSIGFFKLARPNNPTSAHYLIRSSDGQITQMVKENQVAYHVCNYNGRSIGIEHEGFADDPAHWYTSEMLMASAKLVADICQRYAIPADRQHIVGHDEVAIRPDYGPCAPHHDPGNGWPWASYIQMVKDNLNPPTPVPAPSPIPPNPSSGVKAASWVIGWQATDGYPIAPPLTETLEDGKPYTTQYFARTRFQLNPDGTVGRGLIGTELYTMKYPKGA